MSSDPLYQFDYIPKSIWGDSIRPFPTVFLNWISPSDSITVVLQGILSIFSWVLLFRSVQKLGEVSQKYILAFFNSIVVFIIGLSQAVIQFDRIILSESISLTLFIALIAIFLHPEFIKFNFLKFLYFSIIFYLCLITRPNSILLSIPFLIYFIHQLYKSYSIKNLYKLIFITLIIGVAILYNLNQNNAWSRLISRPMTTLSYYLSTDNPSHKLYIKILNKQKNAPSCIFISQPLEGGKQMEWGSKVNRECNDGKTWAQKNVYKLIFNSYFSNFPEVQLLFIRNMISSTRIVVASSNYIPIPNSIVEMVMPSVPIGPALADRYETKPGRIPASFYDPLVFWLALLICLRLYKRKFKDSRNYNGDSMASLNLKLFVLSSGLIAMWISSIILIPGPDGELWRLVLTPNLILRILLLFAINIQLIQILHIQKKLKLG